MARSGPILAARIATLHSSGLTDVMIATKLQIGLPVVRRVLAPPAPKSAPAPPPQPIRRRIALIDGPSPVDVHVGRQVRLYRTVAGLSQTQLGGMVGLTFQQIQKYERGHNRISASVLARIASTLGVEVHALFPEQPEDEPAGNEGILLRREAIELSRAFERIQDPGLRTAIMDLFLKLESLMQPPTSSTGTRRPEGWDPR